MKILLRGNEVSKKVLFTKTRFNKFKKFFDKNGWNSPYFMPREAAEIFLKVKKVRVERLQDITDADAIAEGIDGDEKPVREAFSRLWNSTLKGDKAVYSWENNPWVIAYDFEKERSK